MNATARALASTAGRTRYVLTPADPVADRDGILGLAERNLPKGSRAAARFAKYYDRSPYGPPYVLLAREEASGALVGMSATFPARLWIHGEPLATTVGG